MQQVFTAGYYIGKNYPSYFLTLHWKKLKVEFIYSNPRAKCWVCGITNTLLPHHERYTNLFHEKLNYDIFILCFNCHSELHFYKMFGIFKRKTKLITRNLKKRRLNLKYNNCIQNKRFFQAGYYFLICIMS